MPVRMSIRRPAHVYTHVHACISMPMSERVPVRVPTPMQYLRTSSGPTASSACDNPSLCPRTFVRLSVHIFCADMSVRSLLPTARCLPTALPTDQPATAPTPTASSLVATWAIPPSVFFFQISYRDIETPRGLRWFSGTNGRVSPRCLRRYL